MEEAYFANFNELILPLSGIVTFIAENTQLCHRKLASLRGNRRGQKTYKHPVALRMSLANFEMMV